MDVAQSGNYDVLVKSIAYFVFCSKVETTLELRE